MKEITYHDRRYLRSNDLVMTVDEEKVHFINGIAAVNATVNNEKTYSGIINEEYQEVFDNEYRYGEARRYLMFLDFLCKVRTNFRNILLFFARATTTFLTYFFINAP